MDFHKEDQLKNMPQTVLCDTFYLLKQAVSSIKAPSQSKHRNELALQYRQRPTRTSKGQSALFIRATQSSTQVKISVVKTVDFLYQRKSNVEKSFTKKTSPFRFCLFKGWAFLLTLRSVRKPNLQYIICCCLAAERA